MWLVELLIDVLVCCLSWSASDREWSFQRILIGIGVLAVILAVSFILLR